ncbi:MAG: hypothetical protein BWX88_01640 [Planctomycetes bacterium ADurb.Bin126]|nr:MAG: hypothetical protein BWX88_01640 [Planctomycetes bacterium ADurb.Bin126]HOD82083.1 right-handed parallel beta-helix repeat-containing protein [Phycisphaerae bacterium]HQL73551.1 right-handed parallel beta-helix repeat-containing protein [Phycisphaerae bacterium]
MREHRPLRQFFIIVSLMPLPPSATLLAATPPQSAPARNEQAIAEVKSGKRTEAMAAWWGFDPQDATDALQSAIDSGAKRVIVDDMVGRVWIVRPIRLASDQEIVLRCAEIHAKRGEFRGKGDSLFTADGKRNITIRGGTLRMWKEDYDDPAKYAKAEWRHVLCLKSCSNVNISSINLDNSGGDGIYLGVSQRGVPCSDVTIRNVGCTGNYRQGISVISARNLLIENCSLSDTGGTAPMAGIDFEPNHESEELVNCVMRKCVSDNNKGDAYTFYLPNLTEKSKPVSIRIEYCRSVGCRTSARIVADRDGKGPRGGSIEFIGCVFEESERSAIAVHDKPQAGPRVRFVHCRILEPAQEQPATPPILLAGRARQAGPIGGIEFVDCIVKDKLNRTPMAYQDHASGLGLGQITGTIYRANDQGSTEHPLTRELLQQWMPHKVFKQYPAFEPTGVRFVPVGGEAKDESTPRQRGQSKWMVWAEEGRATTVSVAVKVVGKSPAKPATVTITPPKGKPVRMKAAAIGQETVYEFTPRQTGAHVIECDAGSSTVSVRSGGRGAPLYSQDGHFHLLGTTGRLFFHVPGGTKEFAVKVWGDNAGERVKAALLDPSGKVVHEKDGILGEQFIARPASSGEDIWSLRLDRPSQGVLEDFHVELQGVPPLLAPSPAALLKPSR